jgi:hypothetical protein
MAIYAVHSPLSDVDPTAAFDRSEFLRVGFSTAALVLGPFWLLAKRLWRGLAIWIVGAAIVGFALASGTIGGGTAFMLYALSAVFLGVEGNALQGETLARSGRPLVQIVGGADPEEAELKFLAATLSSRPAPSAAVRPAAAPRGGPHIIGFFPEAGG